MESFPLPAGEFQLELSCTDSDVCTEMDSPELVEISSDSEVEILASKMPLKVLDASQELLKMKDEERYGYSFRIRDRQAHIEAKLNKVKEDIARESPEARQARRKNFQTDMKNHPGDQTNK